MKNSLLLLLIGLILITNSCQKDNNSDLVIDDEWEEAYIEINEYILASRVIDSTLILAAKNTLFEVNTSHEVIRHEIDIPEYWQLQESIISDKLLLRIFAVDSSYYLEFRPIKNLSEKFVLGYEELGIENRIRGVKNVSSETNGVFISSTRFVFGALEFVDYKEFILELNVILDGTLQSIQSIEVNNKKFLPFVESTFGESNARITNIHALEGQAIFSMGVIQGTLFFKDGQFEFKPELDISPIYEENGAWYYGKFGYNTLYKSLDKGATWENLGNTTIAYKIRRLGKQTVGLSKYNRIDEVGESIEEIESYRLNITDENSSFGFVEYFNEYIYLGNFDSNKNKTKILKKRKF